MDAKVLVFKHESFGLGQRSGREQILSQIDRRSGKPPAQLLFIAIAGDGQAQQRADVDAGVAFDAFFRR